MLKTDRGLASTARGSATTTPTIHLLRIKENLSAAWYRFSGTFVENLPRLECAERYDRAP
jgi:DNA adenine methylase